MDKNLLESDLKQCCLGNDFRRHLLGGSTVYVPHHLETDMFTLGERHFLMVETHIPGNSLLVFVF